MKFWFESSILSASLIVGILGGNVFPFLNLVQPQKISSPPLTIIRTDSIPKSSILSNNEPITLGLSKSHENSIQKENILKGKGLNLLGAFGSLSSALKSTVSDNTILGKKRRQEDIKYLFIHRPAGRNSWIYLGRDTSGVRSGWNMGKPVKVLIHGYTHNVLEPNANAKIKEQGMFDIGEAYSAKHTDYNIIIVDWTCLSSYGLPRYFEAVDSTQYAGDDVANFLVKLYTRGLITKWENVHIIGFSLGSHVAGVAGNRVRSLTNSKVGRITGLDPAGPLFDDGRGKYIRKHENVLDWTDANFVDIIHCNSGPFLSFKPNSGALGTTVQAGHADFYPDSGESQGKCSPLKDKIGCSHAECPNIFRKSITQQMLSCPCDTWKRYTANQCRCTKDSGGQYLGEQVGPSAKGKYYLRNY